MNLAKIKKWIAALRVAYVAPAIFPAMLAGMIAFSKGQFNLLLFVVVILGLVGMALGCYLTNDYLDYKSGVDILKDNYLRQVWERARLSGTVYRTGHPFIDKQISPELAPYLIAGFYAVAFLSAIYLAIVVNFVPLVIGILGFLIAYFYTAKPIDFGSRGLGEFSAGFAYGPLIMIGTYYTLTKNISMEVLLASVPVGVLVTSIRLVDEIPGYEAHKTAGENNLCVRVGGPKNAVNLIPLFFTVIYMCITTGVIVKALPYTMLIVLVTIPMAYKVIKITKGNYDNLVGYLPAIQTILKLFVTTITLMCISYTLPFYL